MRSVRRYIWSKGYYSLWALFLLAAFGLVGCGLKNQITGSYGSTSLPVSVSLTGLSGGSLTIEVNGQSHTLSANGTTELAQTLSDGQSYTLVVTSAPDGLSCVVTNGSGSYSSSSNPAISCSSLTETAVTALYPTNGANFLDYVADDDVSMFEANDLSCTAATDPSCIHGGEVRKLELDNVSSCTGITAQDSLDAFEWLCRDLGGTITVVSKGLKPGKGLGDLITGTSFRSMSLSVYQNSSLVVTSDSTQWWTNTISNITQNTGSGDAMVNIATAGQIYIEQNGGTPGTVTSNGIEIDGHSVAFVVMPGVTLRYAGGAADNCTLQGEAGADYRCLITTGAQNYVWVEGVFDGDAASGSDTTMVINVGQNTRFGRFNKITVSGAVYDGDVRGNGIRSYNAEKNLYTSVTAHSNGGTGIDLGESYSTAKNIVTHNNSRSGMGTISGSQFNSFYNLRAVNNGTYGYSFAGNNNVLVNLWSYHNGDIGLEIAGDDVTLVSAMAVANENRNIFLTGDRNTLLNLTASSSTNSTTNQYGFEAGGTSNNGTVVNLASFNNDFGLNVAGEDYEFHNVLAANNATYGISTGSTNNNFSGWLKVGNNGGKDCNDVNGGANTPGVLDPHCANASTNNNTNYGTNSSDAVLKIGANIFSSLQGEVSVDDSANSADSNGYSLYQNITDWISFLNVWRLWKLDGTTDLGLDSSHTERCETSGDDCRIWDYRLSSTDTMMYQRVADGESVNDSFTPGGVCPAYVAGSEFVQDQRGTPQQFLKNAVEIIDDLKGDDDGLCESNEDCLLTQHIGAYQGTGTYTSEEPCTITDGTVTSVRIYRYPSN